MAEPPQVEKGTEHLVINIYSQRLQRDIGINLSLVAAAITRAWVGLGC